MKTLLKAFNQIELAMERLERNLSSLMFAALFLVFVVNVIFRYFFKAILWGHELSLLFFLWITIFGGCYANRTDENIKFDSVYNSVSDKRKCVLDIIGSSLVVSTFTISLIPSIQYIIFLNFEMSDSLPFRKSVIFSVYIYFLVSMILQYSKKLVVSINTLSALSRRRVSS